MTGRGACFREIASLRSQKWLKDFFNNLLERLLMTAITGERT
jgi:hypothetical protein